MLEQEPKSPPPANDGAEKRNPYPDEHLKIMAEFIFKRSGRRATLHEAEQAITHLARVMQWLYKHRNDPKKKK